MSFASWGFAAPAAEVDAFVAKGFESVEQLARKHVEQGLSKGFSVAAYIGDELVVDIVAGRRHNGDLYTRDTLQRTFSSGKNTEVVGMLWLVDRGLIDLDMPIATYWPEFAQGGKEKVLVKDLMRHQSGVPYVERLTFEQLRDPQYVASRYAAADHLFGGDSSHRMYHTTSRGYMVSELVRRLDPQHRSLSQLLQEEFFEPMSIEWYFGYARYPNVDDIRRRLDPNRAASTSKAIILMSLMLDMIGITSNTTIEQRAAIFHVLSNKTHFDNSLLTSNCTDINGVDALEKDERFHTFEGTSHNGVSNAPSMARLAAMLANGGEFKGRRYLRPETIALLTQEPVVTMDEILGISLPFTKAGVAEVTLLVGNGVYGWSGHGGSLWFVCPEYKLAFAYLMNTNQTPAQPSRAGAFAKEILKVLRAQQQAQKTEPST